MTPPQRAVPRQTKKSASPAERSEELAEIQRRLKREAAERRLQSADTPKTPRGSGKPRGRRLTHPARKGPLGIQRKEEDHIREAQP